MPNQLMAAALLSQQFYPEIPMSLIASRKKKTVMSIMAVLGVVMIVLGLVPFPHLMFPPIITGIGFLTLAWGMK